MKVERALEICGLSKYSYYKKLGKRKKAGRKPSTTTLKINTKGEITEVDEGEVLEEIIKILTLPETGYGYRAMRFALQHEGFIINHKKVYRIMYKYQLLADKHKKTAKAYVKYRRVSPKRPLEVLEMDIKFQYIIDHKRYAFILTVIDCFSRKVLHWSVAYSIKQSQIKAAWEHIIVEHLQPAGLLEKELTLELRNDNDTRFTAKEVQRYFAENHIQQVFTHPYTPQENGHVESFHAILGRSLDMQEYYNINDLEKYLEHFYKTYNTVRLHGSIQHLNPDAFILLWEANLISIKPHKKIKHKFVTILKVPHYMIKPNGKLRNLTEETKKTIGRKTKETAP